MVTENLDIYEIVFKLIRSFIEHIEHLSVIPFGKYIVLGFGGLVVFLKDKLMLKRLRFRKSSRKKYK